MTNTLLSSCGKAIEHATPRITMIKIADYTAPGWQPVVPHAAATVIVLRDKPAGGFEVFMVRRNQGSAFMAGAYVFPGGRVDPADRAPDLSRWCDGLAEAAAHFPDLAPPESAAYHVAAIREMFEEAGILLARAKNGRIVSMADPSAQARFDAHRAAVHAGTRPLREVMLAEDLKAALDRLAPFAHWVTPQVETRRFDTRFFIARMPEDQAPIHDATETTDSVWISPTDALNRCWREEILLGPPTWCTLSELADAGSVDGALEWASRRPLTRIEPTFLREDGMEMLLLPGDPLYDAMSSPATVGGTRFVLERGRWIARHA